MVACSPLSSGTWCCEKDHGDTCCSHPDELLTLGQVSIETSKPLKSTTSGSLSSTTTGDSRLSILNSTSTAFASSSSRSIAVSSTNTVMSSGTTISTSAPVSSSGLSDSAKVGVGLGVPLGVIIIALLASLLYRIVKQVNPKTQSHGTEGQDHLQDGETSCSRQQENLAELELHQDFHELSTEPQPYYGVP
ncbi:hypothetical protein MMC29_000063 [Sticta canariensis]|nr:hypothetical protein [Sticta canariensis]